MSGVRLFTISRILWTLFIMKPVHTKNAAWTGIIYSNIYAVTNVCRCILRLYNMCTIVLIRLNCVQACSNIMPEHSNSISQ